MKAYSSMEMSTEEFYHQNEDHISSKQAINDFNKNLAETNLINAKANMLLPHRGLLNKIIATFTTQYNSWQSRNVFERQWVLRDFKKYRDLKRTKINLPNIVK